MLLIGLYPHLLSATLYHLFSLQSIVYLWFEACILCVRIWWRELICLCYLTLSKLFAQLSNWFLFFCMPRTFSNSLETVLTLVSLYYWPCLRATSVRSSSRKRALAIAALACALRPTSAITWIYVGCLELYTSRDRLKFLLLEVVPIGLVSCLLCMFASFCFLLLRS